MPKANCCLPALVIILLFLLIFPVGCIRMADQRNDRLLSGKYDAQFSIELRTNAEPVIQGIYAYKSDHGVYPESVEELIPSYISISPSEYFGGRLGYIPELYYGVPFFFGFRGNYSGSLFMHGWAIIYCPVDICEVSGPPSRRIDDIWIFVHSSAF